MIGNRAEYEKMHHLEGKLWWYQVLHEKILKSIQKEFDGNLAINILDAGCGTGGMLAFLKNKGYQNLSGFDISIDAVDFCSEKGFSITHMDIRQIENYRLEQKFDVIICNDMLYFLSDKEIVQTLYSFSQRLTNQAIILINIHAFDLFSGTHDVAVGSNRRFTLKQFQTYIEQAGLKIVTAGYWSLFLSPLILAVRLWQNFQLKMGFLQNKAIKSDVEFPGNLMNNLLYTTVKVEEKLIKKAPFGSSLFMIIKKS